MVWLQKQRPKIWRRNAARPKPSKGNTKRISYDLFKPGKTVTGIAAQRGLAVSTIEGHLAYFVALRTLDISEFLAREQIDEIARSSAKETPICYRKRKPTLESVSLSRD